MFLLSFLFQQLQLRLIRLHIHLYASNLSFPDTVCMRAWVYAWVYVHLCMCLCTCMWISMGCMCIFMLFCLWLDPLLFQSTDHFQSFLQCIKSISGHSRVWLFILIKLVCCLPFTDCVNVESSWSILSSVERRCTSQISCYIPDNYILKEERFSSAQFWDFSLWPAGSKTEIL